MDISDGGIMELSGSNLCKKNDAELITNDISHSMISTEVLTDASINNFTSTDCVPPRKRPKRLSISCVERDIQDSFIPFGSNDDASIINVRVISLSDDANDELRELNCICEDTPKIYRVRLGGIWSSTPVKIGSSLRVIGAKIEGEKDLLLNWENGVLIVERNVLVPCTLIAQGTSCRRKAILSHYFRGRSSTTKEMLIGNVVHELFQIAITRSGFDVTENSLLDLWRKELHEQYAEQLFVLNLSSQEVEDELSLYFKTITRWVSSHMPEPKGRNEYLQIGSRIKEVVDIEESIWNSCYGFKAKIDCTLKIRKKDGDQKLFPVELKTGKSNPNTEHVTQVMLYCLALASKQSTIESGLLLYLLDATLRTVSPKAIDLKGILHMRNEIAAGISAISFDNLPVAIIGDFIIIFTEPVCDTHICKWCNQALSCSLLQHCSGSTVTEIFFQDQIKHLKQSHIDYFERFIRWILMEWRYATKKNPTDKENIYKREGVIDEQYELFIKGDMLLVFSEESEMIAMGSVISVK
ncbi:unnamed protein product, partial [Onchocerca ochengi]|uniref:DNA replication ATP-dependent helicase/nuclease DNA2 n=1 Tax=Onchocerca ochengi TaxID=42157 RepID=A0A182EAF6_ONCOC